MPKDPSTPFIVEAAKVFHHDATFNLKGGGMLPEFDLVYETYGTLNAAKSNAILICPALSGHHHVAGVYENDAKNIGWWDNLVGPDKPINTNQWFVIGINNLGGCHGSTGPSSINPNSGKPYAAKFPMVTVEDWVRSQVLLADYLGISAFAAVAGGSLGAMQALQWAVDFPNRIHHAILIASAAKLSTENIAFNDVARQAIISDPDFKGGEYYNSNNPPRLGLRIARMLGHITYLSGNKLTERFGRTLKNKKPLYSYDVEFEIESYLRHQGKKFADMFDANTYLLMTKALDYFDPAEKTNGDLDKLLASARCKFLIVSFESDWRFEPKRSWEIVQALLANYLPIVYSNIFSEHGHDSFLLADEKYFSLIRSFCDRAALALSIEALTKD